MDHSNPKTNKYLLGAVWGIAGECYWKSCPLHIYHVSYSLSTMYFNSRYNGSKNGVWVFTEKEE